MLRRRRRNPSPAQVRRRSPGDARRRSELKSNLRTLRRPRFTSLASAGVFVSELAAAHEQGGVIGFTQHTNILISWSADPARQQETARRSQQAHTNIHQTLCPTRRAFYGESEQHAGSLHRASSGSEAFTVQNQNQPVLWFVRTEPPEKFQEPLRSIAAVLSVN